MANIKINEKVLKELFDRFPNIKTAAEAARTGCAQTAKVSDELYVCHVYILFKCRLSLFLKLLLKVLFREIAPNMELFLHSKQVCLFPADSSFFPAWNLDNFSACSLLCRFNMSILPFPLKMRYPEPQKRGNNRKNNNCFQR